MRERRSGTRSALSLALGLAALAADRACATSGSPSIQELVEVADIDSLSISPDQRHLAFRTVRANLASNSYDLAWHGLDLVSGEVRPIGGGGDPIYADPGLIAGDPPFWTADSRALILRARIDGAIGIWRADLATGSMAPLVLRDEDVEGFALAADRRSIVYVTGPSRAQIERAERVEYDTGILVDSSVDLAQNLYRGGWVDGRRATQRLVGYWFVRAGLLWRWPRQKRRYDLLTASDEALGQPRAVAGFEPPASSAALSVPSVDGDVAEARWDGRSGSVTVRLRGRTKVIRCPHPLCSSTRASAAVWRPGSKELLLTFTDRHRRQSLYLWSVESGSVRPVAAGAGLLSGGRSAGTPCVLSSAAAYCVESSAASPPRLRRIDFAGGKVTDLFDPNANWRTRYSPQAELLTVPVQGGASATAVLLTSPGRKPGPGPLFVNYYSCEGFLRGGQGDEWPLPQLLDSGFAVACVNAVPFSGPQDALATYRTGLAAVRSLVGSLSRREIADRSRVAMGGLSFGSEVATWIASRSNLVAALSLASAQSDPAGYWFDSIGSGDRPDKIRQIWGLGAPDKTPERWKLVSAALNAERIGAPTLLQLPEQEARRIPQLYARLGRSATPAELYAYPDEGHIKLQPRHRLAVYERNLDWFRYWLQDQSDPDPAKAAQYRRWDRLRKRRDLGTGAGRGGHGKADSAGG